VTGAAIAAAGLSLSACATVYTDQEFANYQSQHKEVAVLPFDVTIDTKKIPEGFSIEMLQEQEKAEGYKFQIELLTRYLRRAAKGEYTVKFQDAAKTNYLLKEANVDYEDLASTSREEIARILGVDAVISGTIQRSKPMSTGAAIASALLIGFSATNEVSVNMNVHDGKTGTLLWNFDHEVTGALGSSPDGIAEVLTKKSAKRFPYRKV